VSPTALNGVGAVGRACFPQAGKVRPVCLVQNPGRVVNGCARSGIVFFARADRVGDEGELRA
jgi:hypothetical protein